VNRTEPETGLKPLFLQGPAKYLELSTVQQG